MKRLYLYFTQYGVQHFIDVPYTTEAPETVVSSYGFEYDSKVEIVRDPATFLETMDCVVSVFN